MGRKTEEDNCYQMVHVPKRVVDGFFFFFFLSFSLLVLGFWFLTVALLAWRVVFFFFGGGWVGLGLGLYTTRGKFCPRLDYRQVHVTFFLLMRWEEGWKGMGGRAASGRFLLKIENRQKFATVGLGGIFFVLFL